MNKDTAFEMATSSIRFGSGVTREVGMDVADMGARRVMVVTDPTVAALQPVATALESLSSEGLDVQVFDRVRVEPSDASLLDAVAFAKAGSFDAIVAVGGGSCIDTAKAANLYSTYPAELLTYVNAPIGEAKPVPGPLKPLIAIPTTAGTGSETTGVAIFDLLEMKAKTGIAHRALRPVMGIVDPNNTRTLPKMVAACSGFDVLCHGIESFTALPFGKRAAPKSPEMRPAYQGSNPLSDVWAVRAIEMVSQYMVRAVKDPSDEEARSQMLLAATFAGCGFGNAGCQLPHAMSYPVAGMVRDFRPEGYPEGHPIIPHGMSVVLNAPAVFRFTAPADPDRHLYASRLMGANTSGASPEDAGELLAGAVIELMRQVDIPNGLNRVGYSDADVDALVAGAIPQKRLIDLVPRSVSEEDLERLYHESMTVW